MDLVSKEVTTRMRGHTRQLVSLAKEAHESMASGKPDRARLCLTELLAALDEHVALLDGVLEAVSDERTLSRRKARA